jgi:hypothetical protein
MGYIPSAETVYAVAYLTDTGRNYLFNKNNNRFDETGDDLFEITKFSLSDIDTNYQTTLLLESGEVPDVTGKSEGCLKTMANYIQSNLVAYLFNVESEGTQSSPGINIEYETDLTSGTPPTLTLAEADIPAISGGETPPVTSTTLAG